MGRRPAPQHPRVWLGALLVEAPQAAWSDAGNQHQRFAAAATMARRGSRLSARASRCLELPVGADDAVVESARGKEDGGGIQRDAVVVLAGARRRVHYPSTHSCGTLVAVTNVRFLSTESVPHRTAAVHAPYAELRIPGALVKRCGLSFLKAVDQATASPPRSSIPRSSLTVTTSPQPPHSPPMPMFRHHRLQERHLRSPRRRSWQLEHS